MSVTRRTLIVIVMTASALVGAFDGCLIDCHAEAPTAHPHARCHPTPTRSDAVQWQADRTCHHDHTIAAAEAARPSRFSIRTAGMTASARVDVTPIVSPIVWSTPPVTRCLSASFVALVPLRI